MTESDLATLASRLEGANLSIPVTDYFARLMAIFGSQQDLDTSHRIKSVAFHRSRTRELPWFWPCDEIYPVAVALHCPSPRTVAVIFQFFEAVALIRQLLDGKSIRQRLEQAQLPEAPFVLVALAQPAGRPRSIEPRPRTRQTKDLSDVELWVAWHLSRIALSVHGELSEALTRSQIGKTCQHCGRLFLNVRRAYCSDQCMRAYSRSRYYQKSKSKKLHG